ncbi:MAG: hypothetical protein ACKOEW_05730 [Methylocystis sp.]
MRISLFNHRYLGPMVLPKQGAPWLFKGKTRRKVMMVKNLLHHAPPKIASSRNTPQHIRTVAGQTRSSSKGDKPPMLKASIQLFFFAYEKLYLE